VTYDVVHWGGDIGLWSFYLIRWTFALHCIDLDKVGVIVTQINL
jgi:hypothetical protein